MGHHTYVIPYDTEDQKAAVLAAIKKHNSENFCDAFVRSSPYADYVQLTKGEDLYGVVAASMTKPYKLISKGPTLPRAVLCSNGGGAAATLDFFAFELGLLALPAIQAYELEPSMEKRMTLLAQEVPSLVHQDGRRSMTEWAEAFGVRPAQLITRTHRAGSSAHAYVCKQEGFVVEERYFFERAKAEAYSRQRRQEWDKFRDKENVRVAANRDKYKMLRAEGKDFYWVVTQKDRPLRDAKWLTEEMAAAKRTEPNVSVFAGKLSTSNNMMTTAEIDKAMTDGIEVEITSFIA